MLTNLIAGFLTLALTALVVDRLVLWRDRRQWSHVATIGYRGLARSARNIVGALAALHIEPARDQAPGWMSPEGGTSDKHPASQIRHARLPLSRAGLRVFQAPELLRGSVSPDLVASDRARLLLRSSEWRAFADELLAGLVDESREAVGSWAALMLGAGEPRAFLNAFASLNDELFELETRIRAVSQADEHKLDQEIEQRIQAVVGQWRTVDAKARILTNSLWAAAGEGHHSIALPREIQGVSTSDAFAQLGRL